MADPAVEAARRVLKRWTSDGWNASKDFIAEAAAREALKPIRELHRPFVVTTPDDERWTECETCFGKDWPCPTAKLIYSSEELDREPN